MKNPLRDCIDTRINLNTGIPEVKIKDTTEPGGESWWPIALIMYLFDKKGVSLYRDQQFEMTCGNKLCCNPSHVKLLD